MLHLDTLWIKVTPFYFTNCHLLQSVGILSCITKIYHVFELYNSIFSTDYFMLTKVMLWTTCHLLVFQQKICSI